MAPLDTLIARGIRRVRTELGMPMSEFAALLGVHTSTISRLEAGKMRVRAAADTRRIAALLGVRAGYLLRDCPHCSYQPPAGYKCLRCGTTSDPVPQQVVRDRVNRGEIGRNGHHLRRAGDPARERGSGDETAGTTGRETRQRARSLSEIGDDSSQ